VPVETRTRFFEKRDIVSSTRKSVRGTRLRWNKDNSQNFGLVYHKQYWDNLFMINSNRIQVSATVHDVIGKIWSKKRRVPLLCKTKKRESAIVYMKSLERSWSKKRVALSCVVHSQQRKGSSCCWLDRTGRDQPSWAGCPVWVPGGINLMGWLSP